MPGVAASAKNVLKIVDDLKSLGYITNFTDTRVMRFPVCSQDTAWCSIRISFMINGPGSEATVSNVLTKNFWNPCILVI